MRSKKNKTKIPLATVRRLFIYKRFLEKLLPEQRITSSMEIGKNTRIPAYQVRKDINHIGDVGIVGKGYGVEDLIGHITNKLGLKYSRQAVIVGIGALGTALLGFLNTSNNCRITAGFDIDPKKIDTTIDGISIYNNCQITSIIQQHHVDMGIITVPPQAAQLVANQLVESGVKAILNFAPAVIAVPEAIVKHDIDLAIEMETLSYLLSLL